jgi:S-adenosylmethionine:tRNA ribosyltransferase-isomerase
MDVDLFDYHLPPGQVAQEPAADRDSSRLMVLSRGEAPPIHSRFANLPELLLPGDLLVLNDTRVVRARLWARRKTGGRVELLVLPVPPGEAREGVQGEERDCFVRASRRPRPGETLLLPEDSEAEMLADHGDGRARLAFRGQAVNTLMEAHGEVPLPPYIHRRPDDPRAGHDHQRYQTVFARTPGAVAAPTAGLHFTRELLARVKKRGVDVATVTLHVGPGTFRPVTVQRAEDHHVEAEYFHLSPEAAAAVQRTRSRGGRVIACGTTVVRTLESRAAGDGSVNPGAGLCDLFIYPGHRFRVVDGLVTNFHLPRSSLLMLVSALAGREEVMSAYEQAVSAGYRFYSYGDAMFIPPQSRVAG